MEAFAVPWGMSCIRVVTALTHSKRHALYTTLASHDQQDLESAPGIYCGIACCLCNTRTTMLHRRVTAGACICKQTVPVAQACRL